MGTAPLESEVNEHRVPVHAAVTFSCCMPDRSIVRGGSGGDANQSGPDAPRQDRACARPLRKPIPAAMVPLLVVDAILPIGVAARAVLPIDFTDL